MMKLLKILLVFLLIHGQSYAFTCYLTIAKTSCWKDYDVTVTATDAQLGHVLVSAAVPQDKLWTRTPFICNAGQTLALSAQFTPVIWNGQENKKYPAQRFWKLPEKIENGVTGWNVTVCFPQWFADVPTPPKSSGKCECDLSSIPPIPPVKH